MATHTFDLVTPGTGGNIAIPSGFLGVGLPALKNGHAFTGLRSIRRRVQRWTRGCNPPAVRTRIRLVTG